VKYIFLTVNKLWIFTPDYYSCYSAGKQIQDTEMTMTRVSQAHFPTSPLSKFCMINSFFYGHTVARDVIVCFFLLRVCK